jgi:hypothetical protein
MPRTPGKSLALVLGLVFSTLALRADVTIRYKIDYKLAVSLPSAMLGQALHYLSDFSKQEITLLDAANKRFATMPMKDFAEKLGACVPAPLGATQPF